MKMLLCQSGDVFQFFTETVTDALDTDRLM